MELQFAVNETRRSVCLQAAKEELVARQAEESRYWDTLRFEEAIQKVHCQAFVVGKFYSQQYIMWLCPCLNSAS